MHRLAILLTLALAATALAATALAEGPTTLPTTRPVPLRTVTVSGDGFADYAKQNARERSRADLATYEAALVDAKDRATRAAKVLGVTLGPPVTVETMIVDADVGGEVRASFHTSVRSSSSCANNVAQLL